MQITNILLATLPLCLEALSKTIKVEVGSDGLKFSPATVTAAIGDTVEFEFYPRNHSVVQADFTKPCMPLSGGVYSTFIPSMKDEAPDHFIVTINKTDPIWFYCAQGEHCQSGMVGVINPPSGSDMTLDKFSTAANSATKNEAPMGGIMGGMISSSSAGSSSSMVSSSMSASSMTASPTASSSVPASSTGSPASSSTAKSSGAISSLSTERYSGGLVVLIALLAGFL